MIKLKDLITKSNNLTNLSKKFINENDPPNTSGLLTNPWRTLPYGTAKIGSSNQISLTSNDKTKIQSILLNKIKTDPFLQTHLGLPEKSNYTAQDLENAELEHKLHLHGHGDGDHYTLSVEVPGSKGISLGVVAGLGGHKGGDTHGAGPADTHGSVPTPEIPHEKLGLTATIPLGAIFKKG